MKKTKNYLLFVLAFFGFVVFSSQVCAAELTYEEKLQNANAIFEKLPDTIVLDDVKEIDAIVDYESRSIVSKVKEKIDANFSGENALPEGFYIDTNLYKNGFGNGDLHKFYLQIMYKSECLLDAKEVGVEYQNRADYNTEDLEYVSNAVKELEFDVLVGLPINEDFGFFLPEFAESRIEEQIKGQDITYKLAIEGGMGDGFVGSSTAVAYFYKNGVSYVSKSAKLVTIPSLAVPSIIEQTEEAYINYALPIIKTWLKGDVKELIDADGYGEIVKLRKIDSLEDICGPQYDVASNDLYVMEFSNEGMLIPIVMQKKDVTEVVDSVYIDNESGVKLSGEAIENTHDTFKELLSVASKKGFNQVFKAYELKLVEGDINGKLKITFSIGQENNGKKALVLHKKHDNTVEEFEAIVENGLITIEVEELSPFMVALSDNNAQTGTLNIALYGILAVTSLIGIACIIASTMKKQTNK